MQGGSNSSADDFIKETLGSDDSVSRHLSSNDYMQAEGTIVDDTQLVESGSDDENTNDSQFQDQLMRKVRVKQAMRK